ncbi:sensor domain-containing diguanylate cyclase [Desulfovibrio inopinatus]|uniref:sensor domain-containing diguanylate cyclase n=1 Tax=Desulfovibrio inopinatus TaxID=102109 RepID=UPI0003F5DD19|nr:sensor domain-containing diguanylate cyclase [Desulfovibrio inopinatus]
MSEHPSENTSADAPISCLTQGSLTPSLFGESNDITLNLLENIRDGFFFLSNDTTLLYFNNSAECLLSRQRHDVLGHKLAEAFPEIRDTELESRYLNALRDKTFSNFEIYFGTPPYENWYDIRIHPFTQGIAVFFLVTTAQKIAAQESREKSEQLSLILDALPVAPFSMRADGSWEMMLIGPTIEEMTGFPPSTFTKNPRFWITRIHPQDERLLRRSLRELPAVGAVELAFRWRVADDSYKWFAQTLRKMESTTEDHLVGLFYDISDRKKAEAELRYQNILLSAQQETSPDAIIVTNRNMRITSWNSRFATLWNIPNDLMQTQDGHAIIEYISQVFRDPAAVISNIHYLNNHLSEEEVNTELVLRDDRIIERHSRGLFDKHDEYLGRVWFFRDITEKKLAEQRLQELATTDELTGIANRRHFMRQARHEVERARRYNLPLSLIMLDIDHFKMINDAYGHEAGDRALRAFADIIRKSLREIDIFGRLGGEEFAVALPITTQDGAAIAAERLRRAVSTLRITAHPEPFSFTVSLGVAQLDNSDLDNLLKRADAALYKAKSNGRNQISLA